MGRAVFDTVFQTMWFAILCWASAFAFFVHSSDVSADEFFTLKGHGGPVMDIAVSAGNGQIASASFDNSIGVWTGRTPEWLDGHEAAVNVVEFVGDRLMVSAGDDLAVIIWDRGNGTYKRLEGHTGKVMELAISPDKTLIASASWDGSIGLWPMEGGEPDFLRGHQAGVSSLAFSRDGKFLYSASVDGTVRIWDVEGRTIKRVLLRNSFGVNKIVLGGGNEGAAEWLAYGAVDGVTKIVDLETGKRIRDFTLDRKPILALAQDGGGKRLAFGDGQGFITVVDIDTWRIERDFKATVKGPIWALEFSPDGGTVLAGGIENIVYAWPVETLSEFDPIVDTKPAFLRDPTQMENGERQFTRKCSICHSLTIDGGRKAGPTLFKIMGRKAGTLADYKYSDTLDGSDLVWNEETIDKLFDLGPDHYIPGSKMPMQRITAEADRSDLIEFLKKKTE